MASAFPGIVLHEIPSTIGVAHGRNRDAMKQISEVMETNTYPDPTARLHTDRRANRRNIASETVTRAISSKESVTRAMSCARPRIFQRFSLSGNCNDALVANT